MLIVFETLSLGSTISTFSVSDCGLSCAAPVGVISSSAELVKSVPFVLAVMSWTTATRVRVIWSCASMVPSPSEVEAPRSKVVTWPMFTAVPGAARLMF